MNKPKILSLDYESSPSRGWFYGSKWEPKMQVIDEYETIISCSYTNDPYSDKLKFVAQWDFPDWKPGVWNDYRIVKFLREEYLKENYDIVAGQNSDQFDLKLFNTRLLYWGFDPIPETKTLDTKKIAKSKLRLPSNSLEEMARFFRIEGKYCHAGMEMWFGARDGIKKFQRMVKRYNKQDTRITNKILIKLLPIMTQFNDFLKVNPHKDFGINCSNPACCSKNLKMAHRRRVTNGWKRQYQCKDCGKYTTDPKLIKEGSQVR